MTEYRKYKGTIDAVRKLLSHKGYKVSVVFQLISELGPGALVTVVDPADANDISFARWYSIDDLECVRRANDIFWRYMI